MRNDCSLLLLQDINTLDVFDGLQNTNPSVSYSAMMALFKVFE